jgi:hypothetical protein
MPSAKRKELTKEEILKLFYGIYDPARSIDVNFLQFARAVEFETRECCAKICVEVYNRSFAEWKADGHRYDLGYAHGADECLYAFTGRTVVD